MNRIEPPAQRSSATACVRPGAMTPGETTRGVIALGRSTLVAAAMASVCALTIVVPPASATLPDGRVSELVSNSGAFGEPYSPTAPEYGVASHSEHPFQSAESGDGLAYVGEPAEVGGDGNQGSGEGNEWLARRTASGWLTGPISPLPTSNQGEVPEPVFQYFSPDLSSTVLEDSVQPPLTLDAPTGCQVLYQRDNTSGAYGALFTSTQVPGNCGHPLFAGASADGSKIIFQTEGPLTPGSEEAGEVPPGHPNGHSGAVGSEGGEACSFGCNLYYSAGGSLRLVNVLPGPEGATVPDATFGGYAGENENKPDFSNAISADGSRIFWTDSQPGEDMEHIYVLEDGTTEVQVSGSGAAEFWTATPDGRYALYTEGGALWRFDTSTGTRVELAGEGLEGEPSAVEGLVGANETGADASYVYFVAANKLAANENSNKEVPVVGQPNLYLLHEGAVVFIATLSPQDNFVDATKGPSEQHGDWIPGIGARTAQVTPDGHSLVFISLQALTGYNNVDTKSNAVLSEVFVYNSVSSHIACASCDPTGAPPHIIQGTNETDLPTSNETHTKMRRLITENGTRVFFNSVQPLVPEDTNGTNQDVYEWEMEGEGGCTPPRVEPANGGCVFLLSGGNSEDLSFLLDADGSGQNVFVEHRGPLGNVEVPSDQNEIFDLRVGGGFNSPVVGCAGSRCAQPTSPPPASGTPPSVTFNGNGNFAPTPPHKPTAAQIKKAKLTAALRACKKDKRKKMRVKCERQARSRYGAKRAKRASDNRRAK